MDVAQPNANRNEDSVMGSPKYGDSNNKMKKHHHQTPTPSITTHSIENDQRRDDDMIGNSPRVARKPIESTTTDLGKKNTKNTKNQNEDANFCLLKTPNVKIFQNKTKPRNSNN